jgi:hypothetical protein
MARSQKKGRKAPPGAFRRYLEASRRLSAGYAFLAPLLAVYHLGVMRWPQQRNGAQPIFEQLFHQLTHLGSAFFLFVALGLFCLALWRMHSRAIHVPGLFVLMLAEALAWAGVLVLVAWLVPVGALQVAGESVPGAQGGSVLAAEAPPWLHRIEEIAPELVACAGAGVYEEALFRLVLCGGLILVFGVVFRGHVGWVVPLAVLASALLFSWAHHAIGGEPFRRGVFWLRALMGVLLGGIYWARGLGIVTWTHALYNVAVVVLAR